MSFKNTAAASLLALCVGAFAFPAFSATANLKALDPDNDGTVSLAEAQAAGHKKFLSLDPDKDGTLDAKEASTAVHDFAAADPDKDGTVDAKEYAAEIEAAFKKADPDKDGTLDAAEFATPAGQKLLNLIQ
ncbi:EF-hand domain-containing protein [Methylocella silvestris]|uniref:Calcium-binding protein n=1 Tax=Methylocella silvestris TaxID=199596 RepID=A0A2J7TJJ6_METSI|nr:EF-hand domain-containing protein [Methylocella silvestris]PNG26939.1 calcium-binding protein [Methylocella silvestris]